MKDITIVNQGNIEKAIRSGSSTCKNRKVKYVLISRNYTHDRIQNNVQEFATEEELDRYLANPYDVDLTNIKIFEVRRELETKINISYGVK
jgi:hypothetical protein